MRPFVALIPGHGARVTKEGRAVHDPGASCIGRDSEGRAETYIEEDRVRTLAPRLAARLVAAGVAAAIFDAAAPSPDADPGRSYRVRCRRAVAEAKARGFGSVLALHLHFNAGRGTYTAAIYHPGERHTGLWAMAIESHLSTLSGITRRHGPSIVADFPRADGLIRAAWAAGEGSPVAVHAIVLEAAFIDQPAHWPHLSDGGLDLLADAITAGLLAGLGTP
jgi:hypothetical protein